MQVLSIFWINFDDNRLVQKLIEMAVRPYSMRGQKKWLYLTLLFWGTGKNSQDIATHLHDFAQR